jgi:hypothetical protein
MLFNLSLFRHFPSTQKGEEMKNHKNAWQICFSDGLKIDGNLNDYGSCSSSGKCEEFEIGYDEDGMNRLTNKDDGNFTVTEVEVWEITGQVIEGEFLRFNKEEIKRKREQIYEEIETAEKVK